MTGSIARGDGIGLDLRQCTIAPKIAYGSAIAFPARHRLTVKPLVQLAPTALAGLGLPDQRQAACRATLSERGDLRAAAGDTFPAWVSAARVLNTEVYAERVLADARHSAAENATPPKKLGQRVSIP
jgi:hypothetical protein